MRRAATAATAAALLALAACTGAPTLAPGAPEPASAWREGLRAQHAARQMVVAAHPLAAQAGLQMLRDGGSAADAAIAAQMVLGLVEPQSSGLGGGGFALHYDAGRARVESWDGRETAPAAAREDDLRWISDGERTPPRPSARASGRSIGTPGLLRLLEQLHGAHGRLPWPALMAPAIALAEDGFAIPARLADAIAREREHLLRDPDAAAYFLHADGTPRRRGERLRNPAYAQTLRAVAAEGADALHHGPIAEAIVAEVARADGFTPGRLALADLAAYRAVPRAPVCTDYRAWRVCGMGPPSSGGLAVAQTLGVLAHFDLPALPPRADGLPRPEAAHLLAEASRLAFADRAAWVADTDHVPLPGLGVASLLDPGYLRGRAASLRPEASLGTAPAGRFDAPRVPAASTTEGAGTTHLSVVDARGNAVALTSSVESSLGAWRMVAGFVLNNQLTDFSPQPADAAGPLANRLQPGKRPRSAMAPTLVFRRAPGGGGDALWMVTGSPGGAAIVPYVVKTLVGTLDWGLDAQQSAALPNVVALHGPVTSLGAEHPAMGAGGAALADALRARGHEVRLALQPSGVATILRTDRGWQGGADPRREGAVAGD